MVEKCISMFTFVCLLSLVTIGFFQSINDLKQIELLSDYDLLNKMKGMKKIEEFEVMYNNKEILNH